MGGAKRESAKSPPRFISKAKEPFAFAGLWDLWRKPMRTGCLTLDISQDAIIENGKIKFFNTTFAPDSWVRLDAARQKK
jgi:hypothetical protein